MLLPSTGPSRCRLMDVQACRALPDWACCYIDDQAAAHNRHLPLRDALVHMG